MQDKHLHVEPPVGAGKDCNKLGSRCSQFIIQIPRRRNHMLSTFRRTASSLQGYDVREHIGVKVLEP